jgi:hypothetical protein
VVFQWLVQVQPGVFRWSVYLRQPVDRLRLSLALAVVVTVQGVSVSEVARLQAADQVAAMTH